MLLSVTWLIVALLVVGVLLELYGLWTIATDVREAARTVDAIAAEKQTLMSANKHVVADWIARVAVGTSGDLKKRKIGLLSIAVGLLLQTAANVFGLWVD